MNKNKVLVVGASVAEIPLIDCIHQLGFEVITTGFNENGFANTKSDYYIKADYSDKDEILKIAQNHNIKGIVSACNDYSLISTCYVSEKMGFTTHDTYENAKKIHFKQSFRDVLKKTRNNYPKYFACKNFEDLENIKNKISYPIITKPTLLFSGIGVKVCNNFEELKTAFCFAQSKSKQSEVIVEEYLKGTNHAVSSLIKNGKVIFSFFDNEEYYLNPFAVSGVDSESKLSNNQKQNIILQIEKIFEKYKLRDGLFHCQLIATENGDCYLIDPCRRTPGALYPLFVNYSTSINYAMAIVKSELGIDFEKEITNTKQTYSPSARYLVKANKNGIFKDLKLNNNISKYLKNSVIWTQKGEIINDYIKDNLGILFFCFNNKTEYLKEIENLRKNIEVIVE